MKEFPVTYNDILPEDKFQSISTYFMEGDWKLTNKSYDSDSAKLSWELKGPIEIICFEVATYIKLVIKKYIGKDIHLRSMHTNGQTFGQGSELHRDRDDIGYYSCILFTTPHWDIQWGGEFVCKDYKGNQHSVLYKPNKAVVIPSHWEHYGASPNVHTDTLRTSLGLIYEVAR